MKVTKKCWQHGCLRTFLHYANLMYPWRVFQSSPTPVTFLSNSCVTIPFLYSFQRAAPLCPNPKPWKPSESPVTVKFRTICQTGVSLKFRPLYPKINIIKNYVFSGILHFIKQAGYGEDSSGTEYGLEGTLMNLRVIKGKD